MIPASLDWPPDNARVEDILGWLRVVCPRRPPEEIPLAQAGGRVLALDVLAPEDQPAFDRSAVDGFAVRTDDPGPTYQVVDEIRAGDWKPRELQSGEAIRIATGGALPSSDLRILLREDVDHHGDHITEHLLSRRRNIRFRGEDCRAGQVLIVAGTRLTHGSLALLASIGATSPQVTQRPRILHLATGNEIVPPESTPGPGQIRDSNSTLIQSFLAELGLDLTSLHLPEDETALLHALEGPASQADLVLISGGASVGEHDFTTRALERSGWHLKVRKMSARPGRPLIVAEHQGKLAFGLPGNPLAHFVCLNLLVRQALDSWAGRAPTPPWESGRLAHPLPTEAGAASGPGMVRDTFWPGRWDLQDGHAVVTPLPWRSSGDLTCLARANALIRQTPPGAPLDPSHNPDPNSPHLRVDFVRTALNP
jgi:molybdopterin molybdotransferase